MEVAAFREHKWHLADNASAWATDTAKMIRKYAQAYFSGADQVTGGSKHALPPHFPLRVGMVGRGFGGVGKAFRAEVATRHSSPRQATRMVQALRARGRGARV